MTTDSRRQVLRTGVRLVAAGALGLLAATLGLRGGGGGRTPCSRAGGCTGCPDLAACRIAGAFPGRDGR